MLLIGRCAVLLGGRCAVLLGGRCAVLLGGRCAVLLGGACAVLVGACAGLLAGGCAEPEGPRPERVVPGSGPGTVATPVRILGRSFNPRVHANYDDEQSSRVDSVFTASLGGHPLQKVTFVSSTELTATVPAGLSPGTYDLAVKDPRGLRGTLAGAFRVPGPTDGGSDADGQAGDGPGGDASKTDGPAQQDGPVQQDAAPKPDLPGPCPAACVNKCAGGLCAIDCSSNCVCPAGWGCTISCAKTGVCNGNIDCSQAQACTITCTGASSCTGNMKCGTGGCVVTCSNGSCSGNLACSGKCAISCTGSSCTGNIACTGGPCKIGCSGTSCKSVNCSQACSCSASCTAGSCWNGLTCPAGCKSSSTCVTTPAAQCNTC